jgi:hypothetical protein
MAPRVDHMAPEYAGSQQKNRLKIGLFGVI